MLFRWRELGRLWGIFGIVVLLPFLLDTPSRSVADDPDPGTPPEDPPQQENPWEYYYFNFIRPIFGEGAPPPSESEVMALSADVRQTFAEGGVATYPDTIPGFRIVNGSVAPFEFQVTSLRLFDRALLLEAFGAVPAGWDDVDAHNGRWGMLVGKISGVSDLLVAAQYFAVDFAPLPQEVVECFLPDGTCPTKPLEDCTAAGGYAAPFGSLGDGDVDGVDDGRALPPGRRAWIVPFLMITPDQLAEFEFYEQLQWGEIQRADGDNGAAGGPSSGSGGPTAGSDCCNDLTSCKDAALSAANHAVWVALAISVACMGGAWAGMCSGILLCAAATGLFAAFCDLGVLIAYRAALVACFGKFLLASDVAYQKYKSDLATCEWRFGACCPVRPLEMP